jgi:hypothetical protein
MTMNDDNVETAIGSMPIDVLPIAPDGSRRYPAAVDLTGAEAKRAVDARAQGMDLGVRFEGERLVCFGLRRGTVARDCAEIYEPSPVDGAGIVRLRRTGRVRVSAPMAEALTGRRPTAPPSPTLTASPVPDTRHAPRAGRRIRSTRRSSVRASPSDDGDPPPAEAGDAADPFPLQLTDDITTAPAAAAGELHGSNVVCSTDAHGGRPAKALDCEAPEERPSKLAADDPRLPLLSLLADLIAEDILAGREVDR